MLTTCPAEFSTGGAEFGSGTRVKDMVTGATALAEFAHVVADRAYIIEKGQICYAGTMAELESNAAVREQYLSV